LVAWNLRRIRVRRGLSQERLAFDASVDRSYVGGLGITNLWSGDRLDDMTLNRAPLLEHRNSTSLSSIVSG
jgi:hypothetical protein